MERQTFLCTWQWSGEGYRVWVRDRPRLVAEGDSFGAADENLAGVICEVTGDGESLREYDPPPPEEEQPGLLFSSVSISGERRGLIGNPAELFGDGYCPLCKEARGERTSAPLTLSRLEPGGNAGYAKIKPAGFDGPFIEFFAEAFVARLSPQERAQFDWRPVVWPRGRQRFLEAVTARVHVPFVSLSESAAKLWGRPWLYGEQATWWRCDTCGRTQPPVYLYRASDLPSYYVSAASLPDPLPTCFAVGDPELPRLCFTRQRWSELVKLPEARGFVSSRIGVVSASLVDPEPPMRSLAQQMRDYPPDYP